ncbi:MAG TPA: FHA domain-containing protein [Gemmatimonadaceae bacterium]
MPRLVLDGAPFVLPEGETVVGSGAQADWRVGGRDLMARHFALRVHGTFTTLHPSSTESVVSVDGDQVMRDARQLVDGSRIDAGTASFLYWEGEPRLSVAAPPAPRPPAYLVDENSRTAYPLNRASTGIGRDPSNAILVRDPTASRFHAEIRREAGGYALHAMGSSGTRLNGTEITAPRLLCEGDSIEIAYTTLRYSEGPVAPELKVVDEPAPVTAATPARVTQERARISLGDLQMMERTPRNTAALVAVGGIAIAVVVAIFIIVWVLR